MKKRLAIIGAGSSGLICLKNAIDELPDWDLVCLEKSDNVRGCWGSPYPGFVSTSTKYTTQFACFAKYDASVNSDGGCSQSEFFQDGEYGDYLEKFADAFQLRKAIQFGCEVQKLWREDRHLPWRLTWRRNGMIRDESFDSVVVATGLAFEAKSIDCETPTLYPSDFHKEIESRTIQGKRVVVMGGGESAVDIARRLADPTRNNQVFLSLRSGVRVSPRYHPIRGVPSDFLRNRLMLSIDPDLRNWIGQRFVTARIRHQRLFEKCFPSYGTNDADKEDDLAGRKRHWALRLTKHANANLFDMFHNKSDDFLDAVVCGEITPVGPPIDDLYNDYRPFGEKPAFGETASEGDSAIQVDPDWIVPAIGYRSGLKRLTEGRVNGRDFYLGCIHITDPDLFQIGFARPILGNIPSISEMQARYVCGMISGKWERPSSIVSEHEQDRKERQARYGSVNLNAVYPVEMFPYCDDLATRMNAWPNVRTLRSLTRWWRMQRAPATTLHYIFDQNDQDQQPSVSRTFDETPIYLPVVLTVLLLMLKPIDAAYRCLKLLGRGDHTANLATKQTSRSMTGNGHGQV